MWSALFLRLLRGNCLRFAHPAEATWRPRVAESKMRRGEDKGKEWITQRTGRPQKRGVRNAWRRKKDGVLVPPLHGTSVWDGLS